MRDWLLAHGAPPEFHIPASLMPLESFACSVVDVRGQKTYLSCYWREEKPGRGDHEQIHLLVGKRSDFRDGPSSTQPLRRELNGWSFASWSEGEVVYTLATAAPPEKLDAISRVGGIAAAIHPGKVASGANVASVTQCGALCAAINFAISSFC